MDRCNIQKSLSPKRENPDGFNVIAELKCVFRHNIFLENHPLIFK